MEVISAHLNADFDAFGSMLAASKLYPEATLVFAGGQGRGLQEFCRKNPGLAERFKNPGDINLDEITRLILVDVRRKSRIGPFAQVAERSGVDIHIFDHHEASGADDLHGSQEHIAAVGAAVTIFARLFEERRIRPTPEEATLMMIGLHEDTNDLLSSSTTADDCRAAAFLLSCGAELNTVGDFLAPEFTVEKVQLLHQMLHTLRFIPVHEVEVAIAQASARNYVGDLAELTHKLRDMKNLDALVVAARLAGRVFLVGRSRIPEVPMDRIMGEFGGGGHAFAASASVRDLTLIQVLDRLPSVLEKHVRHSCVAADIMSSPVKSIAATLTIGQARELFNRYNVNAMPVLREGTVIGIVTRHLMDKAFYHGLEEALVTDYMDAEFATVPPDTPVKVLQEMLLERNQRFFPIVENGELVGALTRTDLLRQLIFGQRSSGEKPAENLGRRRQLARQLRSQLSADRMELLEAIGSVGDEMGVNVLVVGGFVRDLLLRQENFDIDIVVDGDGIAFAERFREHHPECRVRAHAKFHTAVLIFPDDSKVDVASARWEYYLSPGALPQVEYASIKNDLYRRDFTINTLAISLNRRDFGELLDFFGGQRDLRDKVIRVLHNLSFVEDPTRIFRAIRLEQRLGFRIGQNSEALLKSAVRAGFIDKVAGIRLLNELIIIFRQGEVVQTLRRMAALDVLRFLHPALTLTQTVIDLFDEVFKVLNWYELLFLQEPFQRWVVLLLCLTSGLDDKSVGELCERLNVVRAERRCLTECRTELHKVVRQLKWQCGEGKVPLPSQLFEQLRSFPPELLVYGMALLSDGEARQLFSQCIAKWRFVTPELTGHDLKAMGYTPGENFQRILKALLDARLDGWVKNRAEEIDFVKKMFI
ncbi:MAG: CBS domain-containing protein [Deltaproteobacteria bacterium]|nr:CBS domain-containing protein [Deltaproteobacteria bacterium]